MEYIIHLIIDNVFIPNAIILLSTIDFTAIDLNNDWDNWENWDKYTTYEINGNFVSVEVFNEHKVQYGLDYIWGFHDRTNDIEIINSMTILQAVPINYEDNENE